MNTKTALIYGISMIIALCAHSWLQRPEPFRRPLGHPPTANLTYMTVPASPSRVRIVAIDSLTGEMWYVQLGGSGRWIRQTDVIDRRRQ